jgi:hypothetical protein
MIGTEEWLDTNDAYLAASVNRLHERLRRLGESNQAAGLRSTHPSSSHLPPGESRSWFGRHFGGGAQQARQQEHEEESALPALEQLRPLFGLSAFELDTLMLCAAMELDTETADLCAAAQGRTRAFPTFALAMELFEQPEWRALSPDRPLRYWRLIQIVQAEDQPLITSALRADMRIVNFLKGSQHLDERLAPFVSPLGVPPEAGATLARSQAELANDIAGRVQATVETAGSRLPVVQLVGPEASGKARLATEAGRQLGVMLYLLSAAALPSQLTELHNWIRLWQREASLLPLGLVVDAGGSDESLADDASRQTLLRFLRHVNTLTFLICRDALSLPGVDTLIVEAERPTQTEQAQAWAVALDFPAHTMPTPGSAPFQLASQYNLDLADIHDIAARQKALARMALPELWEACLSHSRPGLDLLAQRIVSHVTWDNIVVPSTVRDLLQEIADQVDHRGQVYETWGFRNAMSRGLGISVLFDGESGTGKTMAAEVIANHLHLNLYRIDLSAVVSKYIGETEKNLRRLFDAADNGGGILFFDEADSIFGKRSEVRDSHDRYANIEINYLLQRIEAYGGLAILATNMKSALDQAFLRRLRFIVKFPVPGAPERRLIWTKVFPPETPLELEDPTERLDYDRLAKVNLTGGSIHNAALNAAFLAARAATKVTMSLLIQAINTELKKLDRPLFSVR